MDKFHSNLGTSTSSQEHTAPSALQRFVAFFRAPVRGQKSLRFITGAALIAGSFLVYLAYPVIYLYLPVSGSIKAGATVAVWVLSWTVFSAGILLTGPEGYAWLRGLWMRKTSGHSGKKTG